MKTTVYEAAEVEKAIRFLASGKHIGKIVLKVRENENDMETLPISVVPRVYCNSNFSYIIPGGLGGRSAGAFRTPDAGTYIGWCAN